MQTCPPPLTRARQPRRASWRGSRRRRRRRGAGPGSRPHRHQRRHSLPGSLRAYLPFMTSPPDVLLWANATPVFRQVAQSAPSRGGAPGAVRGGCPPGRAALLSLVVVVKTRSVRGEGPGCNVPTANDGGHVTTARAGGAAVTPGTCSLTGAGLTAARWPPARRTGWRGRARPRGLRLQGLAPALTLRAHRWPFLREKRAKPAFIPQMQPERHPGLPHAY